MLHLFTLKVQFKSGIKWSMYILAENITWLNCWYTNGHKDSVVVEVEMKLLVENAIKGTGAKGITNEQAKIYLVD